MSNSSLDWSGAATSTVGWQPSNPNPGFQAAPAVPAASPFAIAPPPAAPYSSFSIAPPPLQNRPMQASSLGGMGVGMGGMGRGNMNTSGMTLGSGMGMGMGAQPKQQEKSGIDKYESLL